MGARPPSMRGEQVERYTDWNLEENFDQLVYKAREFHGPEVQKTQVMDPELFNCLKKGNSSAFIELLNRSVQNKLPLSTFFNKSTPSGNTVFHVAARSPNASIVNLLIRLPDPDLFERTNSMEDTPLHTSADSGNLDATKLLIKYAKEKLSKKSEKENLFENFLRKMNKKGNTALHNAVIKKHTDVAKSLIDADPTVAYMQNREVKSPLYLAAQNGDRNMLQIILENLPKDKLPISLLEGKSPANAAIERRDLDMLKIMERLKPELILHKDEKEETPLHVSSRKGYFEGVQFLLEKHRNGAFERNKKGLYPIHIASRKGHINVVDRLLKEWPDPMELLTENGRTILHVSAEKGREDVVNHLLKNHDIVKIINEKDEDGNTALHLATMRGRSMAVYSLVKSKMVDWKSFNNENKAPFQIIEQSIHKLEEEAKDEKHELKSEEKEMNGTISESTPSSSEGASTQEETKSTNLPNTKSEQLQLKKASPTVPELSGRKSEATKSAHLSTTTSEHSNNLNPPPVKESTVKKQNHLHRLNYYEVMMTSAILHFHGSRRKGIRDYMRVTTKPLSKEELKSRIENLLVVAILVASVTFAGAIQIPGTNGQGGGNGATNVLGLRSPASKDNGLLKVYIFLDVMALNTSIMASLILCWAKITTHLIWLASILIGCSIYLMCLAFVFAAAIAVSENTVTFSVLLLIASVLFLLQSLLCLPLIIPPNESKAVEKITSPYIYYGIFHSYLLFQKLIAYLPNHHHNHHHHKK